MTGKKGIKKNIGQGLLDHVDKLSRMIAKGNRNEEETRRWVIDVLVDAFGYHPDQIETEIKALGKRVDIAITSKGKVLIVIECKASNLELKQAAVNQAANYATSLGAEWAAVTNGQVWQLFHVCSKPGAEANIVQIFDIGLFDEDGISKNDLEWLFLLTEQALVSGEAMQNYHWQHCTSDERILSALLSDPVIQLVSDELSQSYQAEFGVEVANIDNELISEIIKIYLSVEVEEVC